MHIISNQHIAFDDKLVCNLMDCSLPVSLIPNNDYAAVVTFKGENFLHLVSAAMKEPTIANRLIYINEISETHMDLQRVINRLLNRLDENSEYNDIHDIVFKMNLYFEAHSKEQTIKNLKNNVIQNKDDITNFKSFLEMLSSLVMDEAHSKHNKTMVKDSVKFIFNENEIVVTEQIRFYGDSHSELLHIVKEYIDKHAPYVLEYREGKSLKKEVNINTMYGVIEKINETQYNELDDVLYDDVYSFVSLFMTNFNINMF